MTLHATRDGQSITIHGNVGVDLDVRNSQLAAVHIKENAQHVRYFHYQLGKLLDAADEERKPEAAPTHEAATEHHAREHHGHGQST